MNKKTKTYQAILPHVSQILTGTLLCIDPSTGSKSSRPGYAWYEKGKLIESGEIINDISANRSKRLFEIAETIRNDFPVPDILVIEYIPPVTYGKGKGMNSVSLMALQRAIGAILGARPFENLLEIPASAWKKYKPDEYEKTDEWDAICLGLCVISVAKEIQNE